MPKVATVKIYQLAREFEWWCWLCALCLKCWEADRWQKRVTKEPPHHGLACDHCGAPGQSVEADPPT